MELNGMLILKKLYIVLTVVFIFSILLLPKNSFAQSAPENQITVSPSIVNLDLSTDLPEALLTYTNNTSGLITVTLSPRNLSQLENGYKINYLNNSKSALAPFSLSKWMSFSRNTLVIQPHSSVKVFVLIEKNQLTPGGHYGAVMARVQVENTNSKIAVQGVLTSLIFVRTATGKELEQAHLNSFSLDSNGLSLPNTLRFQLINTGNVDITPFGTIRINDSFNHQIAINVINKNSDLTLPQSARDYQTPIKYSAKLIWPGFYRASLALHYGKSMQKINQTITFFTLGSYPMVFDVIAVVIPLGLILLFIYSRFWRK